MCITCGIPGSCPATALIWAAIRPRQIILALLYLIMSALAAARPLREETITVGASIGVALSGGGVLVVDRAEPRFGAKPRAWCAQYARAANTDQFWRGADRRAYVVETTLDRAVAKRWIAAAEAHGWTTTRHHRHPTRDVPVSLLDVGAAVFQFLERDVISAVAGVYGLDAKRLSLNDCFLVKYDRDHPGLETHVDGSEYSFSLPLNDGFVGGGTFLEYLASSVRPRVGEALVHPGDLRHGGAPVLQGVRYVLVGFLKYK